MTIAIRKRDFTVHCSWCSPVHKNRELLLGFQACETTLYSGLTIFEVNLAAYKVRTVIKLQWQYVLPYIFKKLGYC